MEKKYKLNAEIQLLNLTAFLFVSACAGFGFIIGFQDFDKLILLQCVLVLVGIFIISSFLWGISILITVLELKK
ncbi:MAG: hypothetical protein SFY32_04290 [Bacteroidota bacterium]|nr:hypothetical protein [Bacteroidota bacterium]